MIAHVPAATASIDADVLTIAVALLVGGLGTLILATVLADRRGLLPHGDVPFGRWVAMIVAGLSVGAASIHFAVIGDHFAEFPPYGVAFVALAWFQVGWAGAYLLAPDRPVAIAAITVNAGALVVWAASRSVGLPFGPEPGLVEPVGPLDVVAGVMEVALIAVLAWDLGAVGRRLRPALPRAGAVMVLGSSALAVVVITTAAFVVAGDDPHGGAAHEAALVDVAPSTAPSAASLPATAALSGSEAVDAPSSAPSSIADVVPSTGAPSPSSLSLAPSPTSSSPTAAASPSRPPGPTPDRATPAPPTPRPTQSPTAPPPTSPGVIRFGTSLDADGEIAVAANRFGEGQSAVWVADFTQAPNAQTIRWLIVQVLPDGREFEHWREDVTLADPSTRRLVSGADLSIYLHGGEGSYRMLYERDATLLAEGAFDFVR